MGDQRQGVPEGGVDQAVGGEYRPAIRAVVGGRLDALPAGGAGVLEEAPASDPTQDPDDVIVRIGGEYTEVQLKRSVLPSGTWPRIPAS